MPNFESEQSRKIRSPKKTIKGHYCYIPEIDLMKTKEGFLDGNVGIEPEKLAEELRTIVNYSRGFRLGKREKFGSAWRI